MLHPDPRHPDVGRADVDHRVPDHLLIGPDTHGVTRYAGQVADLLGAPVVRDLGRLEADLPVHLHFTERLFGRDPAAAAVAIEDLAKRVRLTVTLHDVPQPTDGPVFAARAAAYGRVVRASHAWATNSRHEHALVDRWSAAGAQGTVIPLPVIDAAPARDPDHVAVGDPVLGTFGYVYPGKGHRQVVRAASALRRNGLLVGVRVVGGAAPGHDDEVDALAAASRARGVPVEVTGRVPEAGIVRALRAVTVPVAAHRNVSASGSVNSWIAAGRRPLVRDSAYAREMAALRPGTITLFDDASLVPRIEEALRDVRSTWLASDADLAPRLTDVAAAYRAWWASIR